MAERKHTNLSIHVQTLSPSLGAFGLIGLFALTATQNQILSVLTSIEDFASHLLLIDVHGSLGVVGIILVLALISLSIFYFNRVYFTLRILEILISLCDIRLVNMIQEEQMIGDESLLEGLLGDQIS